MKRLLFPITLTVVFLSVVALTCFLRFRAQPAELPTSGKKWNRMLVPSKGCARIMTATPEELAGVDIAVRNIACLEELSAGEQADIHAVDREFALIAEQVRRSLPNLRRGHSKSLPKEVNRIIDLLCVIDYRVEDRQASISPRNLEAIDLSGGRLSCLPERFLFEGEYTGRNYPGISRPILHVSIARRLGYPLFLAATSGHLFVRYVDKHGTGWNFDPEPSVPPSFPFVRVPLPAIPSYTFIAVHNDAHYRKWPREVSEKDIRENGWIRSMTPAEETSLFLEFRGDALAGMGRLREAEVAYAAAVRFCPSNKRSQEGLKICIDKQMGLYNTSWREMEKMAADQLRPLKKIPSEQFPFPEKDL